MYTPITSSQTAASLISNRLFFVPMTSEFPNNPKQNNVPKETESYMKYSPLLSGVVILRKKKDQNFSYPSVVSMLLIFFLTRVR